MSIYHREMHQPMRKLSSDLPALVAQASRLQFIVRDGNGVTRSIGVKIRPQINFGDVL